MSSGKEIDYRINVRSIIDAEPGEVLEGYLSGSARTYAAVDTGKVDKENPSDSELLNILAETLREPTLFDKYSGLGRKERSLIGNPAFAVGALVGIVDKIRRPNFLDEVIEHIELIESAFENTEESGDKNE